METADLYVDIGNTAVDFVLVDGHAISSRKVDVNGGHEIELAVRSLKEGHSKVQAFLSSVNKTGTEHVLKSLEWNHLSYEVLSLERMSSYAKEAGYDFPNLSFLGQDLFCDVVSRPSSSGLIVLDLGTATKILACDPKGRFLGGFIMPGIPSFPVMLYQDTDLLGKNPLLLKPRDLAYETQECVSSGALNGTASALSGMVAKIRKEYALPQAKALLTGGNASYVEPLLPGFGLSGVEGDRNLVQEGLARIFRTGDADRLSEPLPSRE